MIKSVINNISNKRSDEDDYDFSISVGGSVNELVDAAITDLTFCKVDMDAADFAVPTVCAKFTILLMVVSLLLTMQSIR